MTDRKPVWQPAANSLYRPARAGDKVMCVLRGYWKADDGRDLTDVPKLRTIYKVRSASHPQTNGPAWLCLQGLGGIDFKWDATFFVLLGPDGLTPEAALEMIRQQQSNVGIKLN